MNEDDFELEFEKTKEHFADVARAYEQWKADGKEPHLFVPPTRVYSLIDRVPSPSSVPPY